MKMLLLRTAGILVAIFISTIVITQQANAATYTVINTADSGAGSLRQAIIDANATAATPDVIDFAIPGAGVHTISPVSDFPTITDQVTIDGETQPGSSCGTLVPSIPAGANTPHVLNIELDTLSGGMLEFGSTAGSSVVRGLNIHSGPVGVFNNIVIDAANDITIECNYLGTDVSGSALGPVPSDTSIFISTAATGTNIQNNLFAGNTDQAVYFLGSGTVQDNLIGTDAAGTTGLGGENGIMGDLTTDNLTIDSNVIGGINYGISTYAGSQVGTPDYIITNNNIGLDLAGSALPNTGAGTDVRFTETFTATGNNVQNSGQVGIQVLFTHTANITTNTASSNLAGILVICTGALTDTATVSSNIANSNTGGGFGSEGINITACETADVINNTLTSNFANGMSVSSTNLTVTDNVVTSNGQTGISAGGGGQVNDNTANSNLVGITVIGSSPLLVFDNTTNTNTGSGMQVFGSGANVYDNMMDGNFTGMTLSGDATINHNTMINSDADGLDILGSGSSVITNNYIGVQSDGTISPNTLDGVFVQGTTGVTIGGDTAAERNYISGNLNNGIHLFACGTNITTGVTIIGNYIGANLSGVTQAGYGNAASGVVGNEQDLIGCGGGGGGGGGSLYVNVIGGDAPGEPNVIAGNGRDGIRFFQAPNMDVFSNAVLPNVIYGNTNLGVNLAADSANNGMADIDLGPNVINAFLMALPAPNANYYLNHPIINSSTFSGNQLTVNYSFQANQADNVTLQQSDVIGYRLDFYLNDNAQDGAYAGYNQAKTHLGYFVVDGSETNATHTFTAPATLTANQSVNVTATVLWNIGAPPP